MSIIYQVLNTENNRDQGIGYHISESKPLDSVDHEVYSFNGYFYVPDNIPEKLKQVLLNSYLNKTRLLLDYGDPKTNKSWGELHDITGYIGRTTGTYKFPILVYNKRSYGGGIISVSNIIKINRSKDKIVLFDNSKKI